MTWGFAAQRRADEFNALVESGSTSVPSTRDADLLELVGALRGVPEVTARPEFVADLRGRLMAEAATALVPDDLSRLRLPERRPTRERRLAALVGSIAVIGATTGVAVASQGALPGDSLYPIKRAIESAHTGLSVGEGSKGATMLANAADRLDEVDALTHQDHLGDELRIADTLSTFTDQATEASDLLLADYAHTGNDASIASLRDFASSSLDQLAALEPLVPADARDELIRAARVLQTIDAEAALRCPTCGGTPIDSIPPVLAADTETILVPTTLRQTSAPSHSGKHSGKHDGRPKLPDVQPGDLGPGSVLNPDQGGTDGTSGSSGGSNPLQDLANGLTGSGNQSGDSSQPDLGDTVGGVVGGVVGGATDGVGQILQGVVDPLTGQSPSPSP